MPTAFTLINIAMTKIKIIKTGEVVVVSSNIAHGLIESGLGKKYVAKQIGGYKNKAMVPGKKQSKSKAKSNRYRTK